jgi:hypothetical protein
VLHARKETVEPGWPANGPDISFQEIRLRQRGQVLRLRCQCGRGPGLGGGHLKLRRAKDGQVTVQHPGSFGSVAPVRSRWPGSLKGSQIVRQDGEVQRYPCRCGLEHLRQGLADGRANHDRAIGEHDPFAIVHGASVHCRLDFVNAAHGMPWHATAPASPTASASNAGARAAWCIPPSSNYSCAHHRRPECRVG